MDRHALEALLFVIFIIRNHNAEMQQFCMRESFKPKCRDGEVIVMTKALYGRMRVGKCVPKDLGYLGCQKDVLYLLDRACSGRTVCDYPVFNDDLNSIDPCDEGLKPYLEVDYQCRKVVAPISGVCKQKLNGLSGVLTSYQSNTVSCGSKGFIWMIDTTPGKQVNVSITDFDTTSFLKSNKKHCGQLGYIAEMGHTSNISICRTNKKNHHIYTSNGRNVSIVLYQLADDQPQYLLEFMLFGCGDPRLPRFSWYKREGNTAIIGCEGNSKQWKLTCINNDWSGVIGNCSDTRYFMWIIIIVCLGLVILLTLSAVILIVKCNRKNNSASRPPPQHGGKRTEYTNRDGYDGTYRGLIRQHPGYQTASGTLHPAYASTLQHREIPTSMDRKIGTMQSGGGSLRSQAPNYFVLEQDTGNVQQRQNIL